MRHMGKQRALANGGKSKSPSPPSNGLAANSNKPPAKRLLSIDDFMAAYRVSRTYTYDELKSGRLRARKAGDRTLIEPKEAERWVKALPYRCKNNVTGSDQ
jgi:hypothetical protein